MKGEGISRVKTLIACSAAIAAAFSAQPALAQSNPFMPPQAGMSRDQIQAIVRQEIEKARASQPLPTKDGKPAGPAGPNGQPAVSPNGQPVKSSIPGASGTPGTPGAPGAPGAAPAVVDPVAELLKQGGTFVGCVAGTPVFKDKIGRRAYFTTKELRESNDARRFTRCG